MYLKLLGADLDRPHVIDGHTRRVAIAHERFSTLREGEPCHGHHILGLVRRVYALLVNRLRCCGLTFEIDHGRGLGSRASPAST